MQRSYFREGEKTLNFVLGGRGERTQNLFPAHTNTHSKCNGFFFSRQIGWKPNGPNLNSLPTSHIQTSLQNANLTKLSFLSSSYFPVFLCVRWGVEWLAPSGKASIYRMSFKYNQFIKMSIKLQENDERIGVEIQGDVRSFPLFCII